MKKTCVLLFPAALLALAFMLHARADDARPKTKVSVFVQESPYRNRFMDDLKKNLGSRNSIELVENDADYVLSVILNSVSYGSHEDANVYVASAVALEYKRNFDVIGMTFLADQITSSTANLSPDSESVRLIKSASETLRLRTYEMPLKKLGEIRHFLLLNESVRDLVDDVASSFVVDVLDKSQK